MSIMLKHVLGASCSNDARAMPIRTHARTDVELLTLLTEQSSCVTRAGGLTKLPDRYGENPDTDPDITRITDPQNVTECHLCDEHGYRGAFVCDHVDHQAAAKRGMDMVRRSMGWTS